MKVMKAAGKTKERSGLYLLQTYDLEIIKNAEKLRIQKGLGSAPIKGGVVLADDAAHEHSGANGPR
jgi:hypothetical protein